MKLHIHGAGFDNKGSHLMLLTLIKKLSASSGHIIFYMDPASKEYVQRATLGIRGIFPHSRASSSLKVMLFKIAAFALTSFATNNMREYCLESPKFMDALLDISGYRFGDKWPLSNHKAFLDLVKIYSKHNKPIILLPQMFGPFKEPKRARLFRKISKYTDLIYARDDTSFDWLIRIGVPKEKIRKAPDITIFHDHNIDDWQTPAKIPYACLVPNTMLLEKGKWDETHLEMLKNAGKYLIKKGLSLYIIQHENAEGDSKLAHKLADSFEDKKVQIFKDENPEILKAFIGQSELLVGARFHAIVAALSQGVPVIAMSWGHKYEELLKDFGIEDFIIDKKESFEELNRKINNLLDSNNHKIISDKLNKLKLKQFEKNQEMWDEIYSLLF